MTKDELEAVAVRLRPSQVKAVLELSGHPEDKSVSWSVRVGYGLERLGLAKRTLLSDKTYLTPLGLDVRRALATPPNGGQHETD